MWPLERIILGVHWLEGTQASTYFHATCPWHSFDSFSDSTEWLRQVTRHHAQFPITILVIRPCSCGVVPAIVCHQHIFLIVCGQCDASSSKALRGVPQNVPPSCGPLKHRGVQRHWDKVSTAEVSGWHVHAYVLWGFPSVKRTGDTEGTGRAVHPCGYVGGSWGCICGRRSARTTGTGRAFHLCGSAGGPSGCTCRPSWNHSCCSGMCVSLALGLSRWCGVAAPPARRGCPYLHQWQKEREGKNATEGSLTKMSDQGQRTWPSGWQPPTLSHAGTRICRHVSSQNACKPANLHCLLLPLSYNCSHH